MSRYRELLRYRQRPRNVADSLDGMVPLPTPTSRRSRRRLRPRWSSGSGDDIGVTVRSNIISVATPMELAIVEWAWLLISREIEGCEVGLKLSFEAC